MEPTQLKSIFQMFDKIGDGRITHKELTESLVKLGIFIPDNELTQMIEKIDVNNDGCVDIDEFRSLYQSIMDVRDEEEDMKEAFNVFDQNGDGFISMDEFGIERVPFTVRIAEAIRIVYIRVMWLNLNVHQVAYVSSITEESSLT